MKKLFYTLLLAVATLTAAAQNTEQATTKGDTAGLPCYLLLLQEEIPMAAVVETVRVMAGTIDAALYVEVLTAGLEVRLFTAAPLEQLFTLCRKMLEQNIKLEPEFSTCNGMTLGMLYERKKEEKKEENSEP